MNRSQDLTQLIRTMAECLGAAKVGVSTVETLKGGYAKLCITRQVYVRELPARLPPGQERTCQSFQDSG